MILSACKCNCICGNLFALDLESVSNVSDIKMQNASDDE